MNHSPLQRRGHPILEGSPFGTLVIAGALGAALLFGGGSTYAATLTWSNTGTAWSTGADWVGGTAPSNDLISSMAFFNGTITNQPNYGTTSVAGIIIGDGATATSNLTFTGSALSLGASGITINTKTGTVSLSNAVKIGANQTWRNNSTNTFTVGASITDAGNVTPFTLTIDGAGATSLTGVISNGGSTGTISLTKNGIGSLTLQGNDTYTGATTINLGMVTLSGASGAIALSASPISLAGGLFVVDNTYANNNSRIADTQAITLSGGKLVYKGYSTAGTSSTETVGAITQGAGASSISVTYQSTNAATLTAASFIHSAGNASTLVNGVNLGKDSASTASVARVILTTAPTLVGTTAATATGINSTAKNTQIVSYLVGEATSTTGGLGTQTGIANTFLTYNATTGLRPLNLTDEFTNNAITAGNNTRITANTTASTTAAINSLVLSGTVSLSITDGKTLTITSGAVLFSGNNTIKPSGSTGILDFGSAEAMVTVNSANTGTISAPITGSGGLTKSGQGKLVLSGNNSYTGVTTIDAGILSIASTGALPGWDTATKYTVASGAALAVGNAVTDANIATMLATGNFAAGSSLGFDTTSANRTYNTALTSTLGLVKTGANTLTLGAASTVASILLDGAGVLALQDNVTDNGGLTLQNNMTGTSATTGAITIAAGKTLTVNGAVRIGTSGDTAATTSSFAISGATNGVGTLTVNSSESDFLIAGTNGAGSGATENVSLDLSNLGTFNATVRNLKVGYADVNSDGSAAARWPLGYLLLANSNTITASTISVGGGTYASSIYGIGRMELGASNTLNVDTLNVGYGTKGYALLMFNSSLASSGSVTIRGAAGGSSTAALNIGGGGWSSSSNYHQQVDFTGGILDAKFGTVTVGADSGNSQTHSATLAIGQTAGANADFTGGVLTIGQLSGNGVTTGIIPANFYIGTSTGSATMTSGTIKLADCGANTYTAGTVSGILTIGQNASVTASSIVLGVKGDAVTTNSAALNLNNGGTLTIGAGGITTSKLGTTSATSTVSFDNGTLRASSSGSLLGTGAGALTSVSILSGGATIDSNGNNVSIDQALTAGAGSGISSIAITSSGSGYDTAPYVQITDATGTGATAIAEINSAGQVTSIIVTNRGQNYTNPTFTLVGGGLAVTSTATASSSLTSVTGGGMTKTGAGTLTLNAANTYSGSTSVANGTLSFSTVASGANAQNLGEGTTVNLGVAGTSSGTLLYTGATGTLDKNINALGTGGDTIQNSGSGVLTLSGTLTKAGTVLTLSGGAFNITGKITGGSTSTFNSDLDINGASVTVSTANNDYTGPTVIYGGGTLLNGIDSALPTGTVLITGSSTDGAVTNTYDLNGHNQSVAALQSVDSGSNRNVVTNSGANGTGTLTLTGTNSDNTVVNGTFGGAITDGTSALTAVTVSGGKQTLSGINTYTGATTVSGGELDVNGSLAQGSAVSVNNAILGGRGYVNGTVAVTNGTINGSNLSLGATTFDGASTLSGTTTVSAGITAVSGTLSFSGVTHSNVTVNNQATLTNGGNIAGDVAVSGLLNGVGIVNGALTIKNGGEFSPGNNSGSTTTAATVNGNFTVESGAKISMQVDGATTAGTDYDQIIVTGAGSLVNLKAGSILNLTLDVSFTLGEKITLIENQSSNTILGTFSSVLISGSTYDVSTSNSFTYNGQEYELAYNTNADAGSVANDLELMAVPEPATWAMMVGGFGLLIGLQRLRKNRVEIR